MSKLMKQTIIMTVDEMIQAEMEPSWIREEVECMFDHVFSSSEWEDITAEALVYRVKRCAPLDSKG